MSAQFSWTRWGKKAGALPWSCSSSAVGVARVRGDRPRAELPHQRLDGRAAGRLAVVGNEGQSRGVVDFGVQDARQLPNFLGHHFGRVG